ncbi:AP2-associated protein kinase 1-like isoform X2 [Telopea speciosissima]|uniref:AP2-associated protein kinase 1-like isoform X2 n=1 Tax=Telopea speciosissima TaxID=54955 RepID=UPI001CC3D7FF|nr:AP2-associated protein kinase 1-like isoform X2 [Telopea speciosissima]
MWRFKPFTQKEQSGLEGRTIDVGNVKVHVRNIIAEGGFSCVYLARDVLHASKQYALKHIICNDEESLELVRKEISVMKLLKGHPNVVSLHAHTILDMGRTTETLLVMEFCEKSLVNVLENRGVGYFEEKQILSIFRDVCNAVFAMHCQSPPVAHRDLKAENLLLGPDGMWKLCDFGSTSTNHKRFERPEEMGIEEDNIRKHTTPAYRAPEMWDLFRREVISEKVDIWALGCLLYRVCYFKSAFDGESKLQILNGNYRIPESPKYSSSITDLIRDMLQESPDARPDITQVWFRVNELLPIELQKSLPDRAPDMHPQTGHCDVSMPNPGNRTPPMPRRSPPPVPSSREQVQNVSPTSHTSKAGGAGGQLGAFWSTQHAKGSPTVEDKGRPISNEEASRQSTSKHDRRSPENQRRSENTSSSKEQNVRSHALRRNMDENSDKRFEEAPSKDFEIRFDDADHGSGRAKTSDSANVATFQNETFNTFVAEFDTGKLDSASNSNKSEKEALEAEVDRLKDQLKQANIEKAEIMSKYEKLTNICRSQRQEIQELKQALAARTPSPGKDAPKNQTSPGNWQSATPPEEKIEETLWELRQGMVVNSSPNPDSKSWQAFPEEPKPPQTLRKNSTPRSVRTVNGHENKKAPATSPSSQNWGFETESFRAVPASSQISKTAGPGNSSQRFGDSKSAESKQASQPAGWAGF